MAYWHWGETGEMNRRDPAAPAEDVQLTTRERTTEPCPDCGVEVVEVHETGTPFYTVECPRCEWQEQRVFG
jgi:predicted RNA-binding Zn-ribbon protein involved in translation (DUF1610 family)